MLFRFSVVAELAQAAVLEALGFTVTPKRHTRSSSRLASILATPVSA